jgi:hypothetical protein
MSPDIGCKNLPAPAPPVGPGQILHSGFLNQKIAVFAAIFISQERNELHFGLGHGADAPGA